MVPDKFIKVVWSVHFDHTQHMPGRVKGLKILLNSQIMAWKIFKIVFIYLVFPGYQVKSSGPSKFPSCYFLLDSVNRSISSCINLT